MPDKDGNETREEAEERIAIVRATQIFGDTPTDPTIGDVVVPAHDEEGANVNQAANDAAKEDGEGDDEATAGEVKRAPEGAAVEEEAEKVEEADAKEEDKADTKTSSAKSSPRKSTKS